MSKFPGTQCQLQPLFAVADRPLSFPAGTRQLEVNLHACQQLARAEGFHQVVIRARIKTLDA